MFSEAEDSVMHLLRCDVSCLSCDSALWKTPDANTILVVYGHCKGLQPLSLELDDCG